MNYDKLIYNTRPVKFNDYINNKYDIVHAELYEDALQRFLHSHIYETIMGVNLYNILNVFNNFLTEFNDDKIDDFVMYVQSQYTEDGFHIFDEEEIDNILNGDVQDQVNYWAVDTNENQITNYGIATENGVKTYVTYSDHKTTRFLHKVYFKSAKKNWSHYYINGVMVY